jgi:putative nucleotidyltransferase with HDIG domain
MSSTLESQACPPVRDPQRQELFDKLFARITEISTMPMAAIEILDIASDPTTGASDLLRAVEQDPSLAARLMRTVNSGYYGLRAPVANLKNAITLLGFKEVRNLALTAYVSQLFSNTAGHGSYRREDLWRHCVAVATCARLVAMETRETAPEEAYLAGLLHDMGYILTDQYLHRRFCQMLDLLNEQTPTFKVEQASLGYDHAELGAYAARKWHFSEEIIQVIRYHHLPDLYMGTNSHLLYCVVLANFLCTRQGLPSLGVCNIPQPSETVFTELEIGRDTLTVIWESLQESMSGVEAMASI